jgi:hypothetical protein
MSSEFTTSFHCIHCDTPTQLCYKVDDPKSPTGCADHPVCVKCLWDEIENALDAKYPATIVDARKMLQLNEAVAVNLEHALLKLQRIDPIGNSLMDAGCATYAIIAVSSYNQAIIVKAFRATNRGELFHHARLRLLQTFPDNKYHPELLGI